MGARRGGETDQQKAIMHKVYYTLSFNLFLNKATKQNKGKKRILAEKLELASTHNIST